MGDLLEQIVVRTNGPQSAQTQFWGLSETIETNVKGTVGRTSFHPSEEFVRMCRVTEINKSRSNNDVHFNTLPLVNQGASNREPKTGRQPALGVPVWAQGVRSEGKVRLGAEQSQGAMAGSLIQASASSWPSDSARPPSPGPGPDSPSPLTSFILLLGTGEAASLGKRGWVSEGGR